MDPPENLTEGTGELKRSSVVTACKDCTLNRAALASLQALFNLSMPALSAPLANYAGLIQRSAAVFGVKRCDSRFRTSALSPDSNPSAVYQRLEQNVPVPFQARDVGARVAWTSEGHT